VLFFVAITPHILSLADCFQSAYKMLYNLLLYYISSFSRTQSKVLNSNNFGLILNLFSGLCWGKKQPPKCTIVDLHHPDLSIRPRSTSLNNSCLSNLANYNFALSIPKASFGSFAAVSIFFQDKLEYQRSYLVSEETGQR